MDQNKLERWLRGGRTVSILAWLVASCIECADVFQPQYSAPFIPAVFAIAALGYLAGSPFLPVEPWAPVLLLLPAFFGMCKELGCNQLPRNLTLTSLLFKSILIIIISFLCHENFLRHSPGPSPVPGDRVAEDKSSCCVRGWAREVKVTSDYQRKFSKSLWQQLFLTLVPLLLLFCNWSAVIPQSLANPNSTALEEGVEYCPYKVACGRLDYYSPRWDDSDWYDHLCEVEWREYIKSREEYWIVVDSYLLNLISYAAKGQHLLSLEDNPLETGPVVLHRLLILSFVSWVAISLFWCSMYPARFVSDHYSYKLILDCWGAAVLAHTAALLWCTLRKSSISGEVCADPEHPTFGRD